MVNSGLKGLRDIFLANLFNFELLLLIHYVISLKLYQLMFHSETDQLLI